jgi:hypothetical protein
MPVRRVEFGFSNEARNAQYSHDEGATPLIGAD